MIFSNQDVLCERLMKSPGENIQSEWRGGKKEERKELREEKQNRSFGSVRFFSVNIHKLANKKSPTN